MFGISGSDGVWADVFISLRTKSFFVRLNALLEVCDLPALEFIVAGSSFFLQGNHLVDLDVIHIAGLTSFHGRTWSSEVAEKTFGSLTPDCGSVVQHPGVRRMQRLSVCYSD